MSALSPSPAEIRVLSPGFQTTVQDLGRPRYAHLGISASGAADSVSLRVGNLLVGNSPRAAALEMTLTGGTFEFSAPATLALTGSEFAADAPWWAAFEMKAGETLRLGPTSAGARCYLCVRGGIAVPLILGSASTHVMTALGGYEGRALRKGDRLAIGRETIGAPKRKTFPMDMSRGVVRVTIGPQRAWFRQGMEGGVYRVAEDSNRMGLRLAAGPKLECARQLLTEGVSLGAVQVPPHGQPIITFVEHQTTGGYPKIANVIAADLSQVGQLRPRDEVRIEGVSVAQALDLLRDQEARICSLI